METYEQKKRRIFGKLLLPEYLNELNKFTSINIEASDLLSIVETDNFIESLELNEDPSLIKEMPFEDKEQLKCFLKKNILDWSVPYILYLSKAHNCGAAYLPDLYKFNLDFKFNDQSTTIFSIIRVDGKEDIVFDYEVKNDIQILEVSIYRKKDN